MSEDKPPLTREGWIAGLRSGEYRQSKGHLYDGGDVPRECRGFCCLGLASYLDGAPLHVLKGRATSKLVRADGGSNTDLYDRLRITRHMAVTLAEKNDEGYTFAQIADLLESDPDFRVADGITVTDLGLQQTPFTD